VMQIHKAVIPAAGMGTRMLPITKSQPKEMMPVVHKPVIQYVVEEAYHAGVTDILIITGKGKHAIEDHFDYMNNDTHSKYLDDLDKILDEVNIFYIRQKKLKGLGDAVSYAKSFVESEPFALLLGDTITIPPCINQLIEVYKKYEVSVIGLETVPKNRVHCYGIIDGFKISETIYKITSLVEKPDEKLAPSNLAILGSYILSPEIFACIEEVEPGFGGEKQLTDALSHLLEKEGIVGYRYTGTRYDIGNKTDWLKANIELALKDPELGPEIRIFIEEFLASGK